MGIWSLRHRAERNVSLAFSVSVAFSVVGLQAVGDGQIGGGGMAKLGPVAQNLIMLRSVISSSVNTVRSIKYHHLMLWPQEHCCKVVDLVFIWRHFLSGWNLLTLSLASRGLSLMM